MLTRLLRLRNVIKETGLCRSSIYAKIDGKAFPRAVPIGDRAVAWVEEEVQAWIQEQINKRPTPAFAPDVDTPSPDLPPSLLPIQQPAAPRGARKRKAA